MDADRLRRYESQIKKVEEPIREIARAVWGLDFVVDTGETCCGHIIVNRNSDVGKRVLIDGKTVMWYPHRAILEIAYSLDESLVARRDKFRDDLKTICVEADGRSLIFDHFWEAEKEYLPYSSTKLPNFYGSYNVTIKNPQQTHAYIEQIERSLMVFWEVVEETVRKYNPSAEIGKIKGKGFRQPIR